MNHETQRASILQMAASGVWKRNATSLSISSAA